MSRGVVLKEVVGEGDPQNGYDTVGGTGGRGIKVLRVAGGRGDRSTVRY